MPIYEFACPRCRRIFSFLSKRIRPAHDPACPRCGSKELSREISGFALIRGVSAPASVEPGASETGDPAMPDFDDPRVERVMGELEQDMAHLDERNPRHMAHMLRKIQEAMPPGAMPKDVETAIRRLEKGEDPDKIEEDMGESLAGWFGDDGDPGSGGNGGGGSFRRDPGLYDY